MAENGIIIKSKERKTNLIGYGKARKEEFSMKFGHFDDTNKEYVIEKYATPLPWINYLGSDSFFTLLSNTAGGYSFYKDAKLRRITRYRYNNLPLDQDGFHIYIRDGQTVWNPGWQPVQCELDSYQCRQQILLAYQRPVMDVLCMACWLW